MEKGKKIWNRLFCLVLAFTMIFQSISISGYAEENTEVEENTENDEKTSVDFMEYLEDPLTVLFQDTEDIDMHSYLINAYGVPEEITFECEPVTVSLNDYKDGELFELKVNATGEYEGSCTVEAEIEAEAAGLDGQWDYSYVPTVTLGVDANATYMEAVGKPLVTVTDNSAKGSVTYDVTGDYYISRTSNPICFEKGMDANITIRVYIEFDKWLSSAQYVPLNNAGWIRDSDYATEEVYSKDFTFAFTNSPLVDLPKVSYTDISSLSIKNLIYNGASQNLVNVGNFDTTKGSMTIINPQGDNARMYTVKVVIRLNEGVIATDSSKETSLVDEIHTRVWQETTEENCEVYTKEFNVTIDPAGLNVTQTNGSIVVDSAISYTPE